MLVFDRATMASSNPPQEAIFAATASGEQLFDLRYPATRAATLASYHSQLAGLRKFKAKYTKAAYQQALSDLQEQRLMATRSVWTSAGHDSTLTFFETDALTNRLAKVRYDEMGWNNGFDLPGDDTLVSRVWTLASQLQTLVADGQATVGETSYEGRPALLVAVAATKATPAWQAVIDRRYGLTLAVSLLSARPGSESGAVVGFHLEDLRINRALPASLFVQRPIERSATGAPVKVMTMDLNPGVGPRTYAPTALHRVAPGDTVVTAALPSGYALAQIVHFAGDPWWLLLYRRGLDELLLSSGPLRGQDSQGSACAISAFHRGTWPDLSEQGDRFVTVAGGVLAGAPAVYDSGLAPDTLAAWNDNRMVYAEGDLSRSDLLDVVNSLRPLQAGSWGRSAADVISLAAVVGALIAALVAAAAWVTVGRRRGDGERPRLQELLWPAVGVVLVIVGAALDWHALVHQPGSFAVRGWSEPLGRWVMALALAALAAAAWQRLVGGSRGRPIARLVATALAAATLSGALLALVYLPVEARFTIADVAGDAVSAAPPEGWLVRIFSSQFSPSATTGLFVSILGALLLLVGIVMMRKVKGRAAHQRSLANAG